MITKLSLYKVKEVVKIIRSLIKSSLKHLKSVWIHNKILLEKQLIDLFFG